MSFNKPPKVYTSKKEYRKAGFEFEFAGLEFERVSEIIIELYGGKRERISRFNEKVRNTELGDFELEFDSRILKEKRYEAFLKDKMGVDLETFPLKKEIEDMVASVSSNLVPFEVILPPVPINELDKTERFRKALHDNKAEGTKASPLYAFAFHINVELPDVNVEIIKNYLKAFLLLQYWIFEESDINFTRQRLTSYINYFPKEYLLLVLHKNYQPDLDQLIKDYKRYNPTRNRPLDLYPLFMHLKGEEVLVNVDEPDLVKPRPTFHYRLPDCLIDDPDWRLSDVWNTWVIVEEVGEDTEKMNKMMMDFQESYQSEIIGFKKKWIKKVRDYLK